MYMNMHVNDNHVVRCVWTEYLAWLYKYIKISEW